MPGSQSVMTTRVGQFRAIYGAVRRTRALRESTPVFFCEGDSWFSTPLAMNLLDWLVYPTPEDEARGVPVFGAGGLFLRKEQSGDLATEIFTERKVRKLVDWYDGFDFDLALLSAGGNDFVGAFLQQLFARQAPMSAEQAFQLVVSSGRYAQVQAAYRRVLAAFVAARPQVLILAHTYDYPQLLGVPADLRVANVGAIALLTHDLGPWIAPHVAHVLQPAQQRAFARKLIDGFEQHVLRPLKQDAAFAGVFDYVDLRGTLDSAGLWFDEMHPSGSGFHALAAKLRLAMHARLPVAKRHAPVV